MFLIFGEKQKYRQIKGEEEARLRRLKKLGKNYESHHMVYPKDMGESGIRKIEICVLEWFKRAWLKNETEEKSRFYLWMEADYYEHFKQYIHNKNAYFKRSSTQNKYESRLVGGAKIVAFGGYIVTFLAGIKVDKLIEFKDYVSTLQAVYKWPIIVVMVILACFLLLLLWYGLNTIIKAEYVKKDNLLRQQKETWIRHVEVIADYQKEMFGFLWNLGEYQNCSVQEEKERLFMENILEAWMKDNKKFQSNMKKENLKDLSEK